MCPLLVVVKRWTVRMLQGMGNFMKGGSWVGVCAQGQGLNPKQGALATDGTGLRWLIRKGRLDTDGIRWCVCAGSILDQTSI